MGSQQRIIGADQLDFERLRVRQAWGDWPVVEAGSDALPAILGRVITADSSLKLGRFCTVVPTTVLGTESEGSVGLFSTAGGGLANSPTILVYLLGTHAPAAGEYLVCRFVDHRWVAEATGVVKAPVSNGVALPRCSCSVPSVLQMTSRDTSCNFGMFQSCTLQYGPAPALMAAFGLTGNLFTSQQQFVDPITKSKFFYYFECYYNQFFLTRIFPTSPFGSPFRDGILYAWVVGGYMNTCNPFYLFKGTAFPGSDTTCSISISG